MVIIDDDKNEPRGGTMELVLKPSKIVTLIGNETIGGLYEAPMNVTLSKAVIAEC